MDLLSVFLFVFLQGRDVVTLYQYSGENESSTGAILEPSVYDNLKVSTFK